jgi:class 3 adenylate cyclase
VLSLMESLDVTDLLPRVQAPTLVMHRRQVRLPDESLARQLAAGIPNARLVMLEGASVAPYLEDMDSVLRAIDEFLGEGDAYPAPPTPALVTVLFTDMEASTQLTQTLGDARAQELVRAHNTIVRQALVTHGGSEIKRTGDGIMAAFPSVSGAVDCAIAIQRAFEEYNQRHPDLPMQVRVGLNSGEPVAEDQDLFGTVVQLAARICAQAQPGQILTSDVVRQLVAGKGFVFQEIGDVALRGFRDPVRLHEVRWQTTTGPR